jgi:hypothetical protein
MLGKTCVDASLLVVVVVAVVIWTATSTEKCDVVLEICAAAVVGFLLVVIVYVSVAIAAPTLFRTSQNANAFFALVKAFVMCVLRQLHTPHRENAIQKRRA